MSDCITQPLVNGQGGGGGAPAPAATSTLLYSQVSTVTVSDAVLNTIVSYTLPANTADTNGDIIVVDFYGDVLQSNGAAQTWSFGISLNAVVLWFDTSASFANSATRRPWRMQLNITRKSATTCAMGGFVTFSNTVAVAINGEGDITTAPQGNAIGSVNTDPVVAWGSNQLIDVAVQASVASIAFVLRGGFIKLETAP